MLCCVGQWYVGRGCEWSTAAGCVGVEVVCVRVVMWMACVRWVGVMVFMWWCWWWCRDLDNNQLTGSVPPELVQLSRLQML